MKNGLTKPFKLQFHFLLINMALLSCQMKLFLLCPSVAELHDKTNSYSPQHLIDRVNDNISELLYSCALYKSFAMTDCLFFIQYIPEDTIKLRCFLVQLKYIDKEILNIGDYHITSLSRHPADKHIYDVTTRWWPE